VLDVLEGLPRPSLPGVRWTSRSQWHVTLRFLGDADAGEAVAGLGGVRASTTEASLSGRTQRLGRGVLCVHVAGLEDLAAAVADATAGLGKPPEHRTFRGHITLARVEGKTKPPLADVPVRSWTVATFALVRSHLGGGPARYETVATWPLQP
jgi:RNA 2',3'-cyclic 3'-phosphodiesterase